MAIGQFPCLKLVFCLKSGPRTKIVAQPCSIQYQACTIYGRGPNVAREKF
jgi:hypothetical protein